ncbi:MAG: phospholipase [Candidatus Eisenbacteria bacterium]|uniref:Phospholipase n=1 Tax=Eiseniibacteriota bacterium TaxID=2212470 RepID=A0A849SFI9_UNCEI|nr:phospholipase [Candidatus Eisenbacteria bacterium]
MPTEPAAPQLRLVSTPVHGRMLVRAARGGRPRPALIGFHGYGQSATSFFDSLAALDPTGTWLVAAVQALHPFYALRTDEVVANWMTREDREHAIADNLTYVDAAGAELQREFGPFTACVFAGFSQGVAMAYRAAFRGRHACDGLLVAGGDLPPELKDAPLARHPRIVAATGTLDTYYPPAALAADVEFLRTGGCEVRSLPFVGGHEWSSEVIQAGRELLESIGAATRD